MKNQKLGLTNSFPFQMNAKSNFDDILAIKFKLLKQIAPVIGYYAIMLAPIYGIGIAPFLGSMTDFSILKNRGLPSTVANEYIVAPKGFAPSARPNDVSDVYPVSATTLKSAMENVVNRQPRITFVAEDETTNRREFVQRSLIFRFPDVVTIQTIPLDNSLSTIAIHSYSIYGESDFGVNGNRVRTWLTELDNELGL